MAAIPEARRALEDVGLADEIDLVVAGGIRNGGDIAKAIALGAKAVAIGHSALMALNCNKEIPGVTDYEGTVGVPAGKCYHCHTGRCPVGITTQDPELRKRLVVEEAAERVYNFLHTLTLEVQMLARACGKTNVHSLEPEDLCALTVEAAAMAKVPLAGTSWIPGVSEERDAREDRAHAREAPRVPGRLPAGLRGGDERRVSDGPIRSRRRSSRSTPSSWPGTASRTRRTSRSSRTSTSTRRRPATDINWLEDIELLQEDGAPAVFDRYSNSFLKIYFPIPAGRENEIARKVLITHLQSGNSYGIQLKEKHCQVPAAGARPVGGGLEDRRHRLEAAGARGLGAARPPPREGHAARGGERGEEEEGADEREAPESRPAERRGGRAGRRGPPTPHTPESRQEQQGDHHRDPARRVGVGRRAEGSRTRRTRTRTGKTSGKQAGQTPRSWRQPERRPSERGDRGGAGFGRSRPAHTALARRRLEIPRRGAELALAQLRAEGGAPGGPERAERGATSRIPAEASKKPGSRSTPPVRAEVPTGPRRRPHAYDRDRSRRDEQAQSGR